MPATPNADDATKPLDSDAPNYPVSFGAAEFRALKAKVNALFLTTGIDALSGTDTTEKLITTNGVGILTVVSHNPVNATTLLYGLATFVTRTGNNNHTVAVMATAMNANGVVVTNGGTTCYVGQAINNLTGVSNVVGAEFAIAQLNPNIAVSPAQVAWGVYIVFKNRGDTQITPDGGLGGNKYNASSRAIYIDAQPRGTAGEFCGWQNGIVFSATSMDLANTGGQQRGYCIDTYNLTYDGGVNPDTAFRVDSVLRMRALQSIQWYDGTNKIKMFFDPSVGRVKFTNNGFEKFAFDVGTGIPWVQGVAMNNP